MDRIVDVEALREEHKEAMEWDLNPVKKEVLKLLQQELSGTSYRKLTREEVVSCVDKAFQAAGFLEPGKDMVQASRLMRKLKKAATRDDAILVLGDYIL